MKLSFSKLLSVDQLPLAWFCFSFLTKEKIMVVPLIALIVVIALVIVFLTKAGKRRSEGKDMGEPGKGTI